MITSFGKKYNEMNLWCLFHFCGKFHTVTMNKTVFKGEFVKLVCRNVNYFEPPQLKHDFRRINAGSSFGLFSYNVFPVLSPEYPAIVRQSKISFIMLQTCQATQFSVFTYKQTCGKFDAVFQIVYLDPKLPQNLVFSCVSCTVFHCYGLFFLVFLTCFLF